MSCDHYILAPDGETPVAEPDLMRWARWFETHSRRVAVTDLADGAIHVSTIFLALDHAFGGGPPILWETMIFVDDIITDPRIKGPLDEFQTRYRSLADARVGHQLAVAQVQRTLDALRED